MGLPGGSNKRRCLLVEATLLAWASWATTTSLFSPINKGKRAEQNCSALLVFRILSKLERKIVSVKKIQAYFLHCSSSFFVRSSTFFGLQSISSRNQIFQFIICTLSGPHLFRVLLFSFRLVFVPIFYVL